jgi:hypothetical protein
MFLLYFVIIFGTAPLLYFLVAKRQYSIQLKAILPFVTLTFFSSLYELIGSLTLGWNVSYWFIIYNILSFFCVFYFYYHLLQKQFSKLFLLILALFFIFSIFLSINFRIEDVFVVCSYLDAFITFFILFFTIIWFRKLINDAHIDNLLDSSNFYFISGLILYFCGTLFLFLFANHLYKVDSEMFQSYWALNIILNLILRFLLLVGLWKAN